jgi:hypothetical protein
MKKRLPDIYYNPISMIGTAIAIVSLGTILFLFFIDLLSDQTAIYVGIVTYIILPSFLVLGLILIPLGAFIQRRREKKYGKREMHLPRIDLNDPRHRFAFSIFSLGTVLLLLLTAIGSFQAYNYTDRVEFCGELCHAVMEPEFVTYLDSPHARVRCVDCHVGPGATWFVRSKLDGAYQVYATLRDIYPRPIPTPIENLRPAQETCETCHWPLHFYGDKKRVENYFLTDRENTKWTISLLMRTGGGMTETGPAEGIHWHMNIANTIEYAYLDRQREQIAWVRSEDGDGNVVEYFSSDFPVGPEELSELETRVMDCMDCHNRPTHVYNPPIRSVNQALAFERINRSLPYIRRIAVEALIQDFEKREDALAHIEEYITGYYERNYPRVAEEQRDELNRTIAEVQRIYSRNFFPEMRVSWRAYPDHIGHMNTAGCFRCHANNMFSPDGREISSDCNICHIILAQGEGPRQSILTLDGLEFEHPVDIGGAWREVACHTCHTGS